MNLSDHRKSEIWDQIKSKWPEPRCPICSSLDLSVDPILYCLDEYKPSGQVFFQFPCVIVICDSCGHSLNFNAIKMGLEESKQSDTFINTPNTNLTIDVKKLDPESFKNFIKQPYVDVTSLREILKNFISLTKYEIQRLEKYIDGVKNQSQNILVVASLASLVTLQINLSDFIKTYLIYVIPYFIASLFTYVLSIKSISARRKELTSISPNTDSELMILFLEAKAVEHLHDKLNQYFDKNIFWGLLNFIFGFLFIISFIVHFYFFWFSNSTSLSLLDEILLNIIFIFAGLLYYIHKKAKSKEVKFSAKL